MERAAEAPTELPTAGGEGAAAPPRAAAADATGAEQMLCKGTRPDAVKVILLGDSAVGKSKLVERFQQGAYRPHQLSTFALTLFQHTYTAPDGTRIPVDLWDTAGQERFAAVHPSYFFRAHACVLVFDVTRKATYTNLGRWWAELQAHAKGIPTLLVANKVDADLAVTQKQFKFAEQHGVQGPFFCSAASGLNVVRVFEAAIVAGLQRKLSASKGDFVLDALELLAGGGGGGGGGGGVSQRAALAAALGAAVPPERAAGAAGALGAEPAAQQC